MTAFQRKGAHTSTRVHESSNKAHEGPACRRHSASIKRKPPWVLHAPADAASELDHSRTGSDDRRGARVRAGPTATLVSVAGDGRCCHMRPHKGGRNCRHEVGRAGYQLAVCPACDRGEVYEDGPQAGRWLGGVHPDLREAWGLQAPKSPAERAQGSVTTNEMRPSVRTCATQGATRAWDFRASACDDGVRGAADRKQGSPTGFRARQCGGGAALPETMT